MKAGSITFLTFLEMPWNNYLMFLAEKFMKNVL